MVYENCLLAFLVIFSVFFKFFLTSFFDLIFSFFIFYQFLKFVFFLSNFAFLFDSRAVYGPLVVTIVLVAKNGVERSFSELWKMRISSFYANFHF